MKLIDYEGMLYQEPPTNFDYMAASNEGYEVCTTCNELNIVSDLDEHGDCEACSLDNEEEE